MRTRICRFLLITVVGLGFGSTAWAQEPGAQEAASGTEVGQAEGAAVEEEAGQGAEEAVAEEMAGGCQGFTKPALEEKAEEESGEFSAARLDNLFGEWVVKPFETVLFFDIHFFDNGVDAEMVGRRKGPNGDLVAASYDPKRGLRMQKVATVSPAQILPADAEVGAEIRVGDGNCKLLGAGILKGRNGDKLEVWYDDAGSKDGAYTLQNPWNIHIPFIVFWLLLGALYFTFKMGFISLRGLGHAVRVTRGDYDNPDDPGEISHFQALSSALSATVGLGNIAGVAIAVAVGGPGALFWMWIAAFLGMTSKFVECTLGQMYREVDARGHVSGGPMRYLSQGLKERNLGGLGQVLAVLFALLCVGGSFGGGNMFQANQARVAVMEVIPALENHNVLFGVIMAVLVGLVIIGGIERIGAAASYVVPFMVAIYVLAGLWILATHVTHIPSAFGTIIGEAFVPQAGLGGMLGVLIQGFKRAAFSNEAGVGSAAIAHSAAKTEYPVREGVVALLEPFIDTIIVCTMTGLVVVITGVYQTNTGDGVLMTSAAFGSVISWFPKVLSVAVLLFAFSTMISWSYYGERCFTLLFGAHTSMIYRVIFCVMTVFGAAVEPGNVIAFSDLMILGMAFPNILGLFLLSGKVRQALDDYWGKLKAGQLKTYR